MMRRYLRLLREKDVGTTRLAFVTSSAREGRQRRLWSNGYIAVLEGEGVNASMANGGGGRGRTVVVLVCWTG